MTDDNLIIYSRGDIISYIMYGCNLLFIVHLVDMPHFLEMTRSLQVRPGVHYRGFLLNTKVLHVGIVQSDILFYGIKLLAKNTHFINVQVVVSSIGNGDICDFAFTY